MNADERHASTIQMYVERMGYQSCLTVVQSIEDLPKDVRDIIAEIHTDRGYATGPEGITNIRHLHGYLIADNISSNRIEKVILHEAVGHVGLSKVFGREGVTRLASKIMSDGQTAADVNELATRLKIDTTTDEGKTEAVDEYFGRIAEKGDFDPVMWQRAIAAARSWLRKFRTVTFAPNDIRWILFLAKQAVQEKAPAQSLC